MIGLKVTKMKLNMKQKSSNIKYYKVFYVLPSTHEGPVQTIYQNWEKLGYKTGKWNHV